MPCNSYAKYANIVKIKSEETHLIVLYNVSWICVKTGTNGCHQGDLLDGKDNLTTVITKQFKNKNVEVSAKPLKATFIFVLPGITLAPSSSPSSLIDLCNAALKNMTSQFHLLVDEDF